MFAKFVIDIGNSEGYHVYSLIEQNSITEKAVNPTMSGNGKSGEPYHKWEWKKR
ncbi:hypothetical protein LJB77_01010 [Ruminococcaceae bacterium OttesenSCG-928-N02]|nr:hypothetical protein [Ruminococcaceae bacterium OttesenSCG-928-N02]